MSEKNIYFIKLIYEASDLNAYILFCTIINKQTGAIEGFDTVVSKIPEIHDNPERYTYRDFINKIQKLKITGNYAQSSTIIFSESLKTSFSNESFMVELLHYLEHNEHENIATLLSQNIARALGKAETQDIQVRVELVDREELDKTTDDLDFSDDTQDMPDDIPSGKGKNKKPEDIIPEGAMEIKFNFVLSPVTGTRIDELKVGDKVMVKILPEDSTSRNVINLLLLKEDSGIIKHIPATIANIVTSESGEIQIIVKITDGIYGKYLETEESTIKVKMAGPESLATINKQDVEEVKKLKEERESNFPLTISLVVGIFIILWIIIIFFVI
ncbi:MAG: hypothetical protein H7A23_00360 [Leptospiraceae bacterium]|nr:hypothetical protein [Leptospiraceae bacterium]MCP5492982.1 hypothetical protein [Leptospiraceae bacterium]